MKTVLLCPSVLGIYKIILLFHITGDSTKHTWPKHYTILQYCNHFMCNQLEKLKAARCAYLWLPLQEWNSPTSIFKYIID